MQIDLSSMFMCGVHFTLLQQLQVREYFLKLIPTRTFTCKVSPSTQVRKKMTSSVCLQLTVVTLALELCTPWGK